jgi:hypothetical protein
MPLGAVGDEEDVVDLDPDYAEFLARKEVGTVDFIQSEYGCRIADGQCGMQNELDGDDDDDDDDEWSDEVLFESPLDKVDVYQSFKQVMQGERADLYLWPSRAQDGT